MRFPKLLLPPPKEIPPHDDMFNETMLPTTQTEAAHMSGKAGPPSIPKRLDAKTRFIYDACCISHGPDVKKGLARRNKASLSVTRSHLVCIRPYKTAQGLMINPDWE